MQVDRGAEELRDLAQRVSEVADGLDRLGRVLAGVRADLATAQAVAVAAGLAAQGSGFSAPYGHDAAVRVRAARAREDAAHRELAAVLLNVREGGLAERFGVSLVEGLVHLPPDDGGVLGQVAWAVGLPGTAGVLSDRAKGALAHRARGALDKAVASDMPLVAGAGRVAAGAAPVATRLVKASGPVGNGLTVATAGHQQWQDDADDPRLSTADRVGRTAVRAGLEGGAALAGGFVGGQYGAAIGTMILPGAGTAIGTVVGAGVGAFVATEAGRAAVDTAVETVDDVIDLAESAADAAGEAASDAAEAVGDAAETVAEKLCFWK